MSKAKDILLKIKAMFEGLPPTTTPQAQTSQTLKTTDGIEIVVDELKVGGKAMINGAPAPANTYTLENGDSITVDATGLITVHVPKPVDTPAAQQQQPATAPAAA